MDVSTWKTIVSSDNVFFQPFRKKVEKEGGEGSVQAKRHFRMEVTSYLLGIFCWDESSEKDAVLMVTF